MSFVRLLLTAVLLLGAAVLVWLLLPVHAPVEIPPGVSSGAPGMVERGAYLVRAGGCLSCHWDKKGGGQPFAGGLPLKTSFGTFYSPNITPDKDTGIGTWSDEDFLRALTQGQGMYGEQLYPAFPYTSFSAIAPDDGLAIKAYLFALAPVHAPRRANDVSFPFSWRALLKGWKLLYFSGAKPLANDPAHDATWNRGRYLVALGHCGECHTPRNSFGAQVVSEALRGNPHGPDGWKVPALVGPGAKAFSQWSVEEVAEYLKSGATPEFDTAQGPMAEVVDDATKHLSDDDRRAIALYLKSLDAH
jgi:mono/diheme cytochrome c family protein